MWNSPHLHIKSSNQHVEFTTFTCIKSILTKSPKLKKKYIKKIIINNINETRTNDH